MKDILEILIPILDGNGYLDFEATTKALFELTRRYRVDLNKVKRILLTTNGSVTRILQSIQRSSQTRVGVNTLNQVILDLADGSNFSGLYSNLDVPPGTPFNFRKVVLGTSRMNYVYAISLTPLCRLDSPFRSDLLRADTPIGLLLDRYKIEMLRRIACIGAIKPTQEMVHIFGTDRNKMIPYRIYDLIHGGHILMKIFEFYNPKI